MISRVFLGFYRILKNTVYLFDLASEGKDFICPANDFYKNCALAGKEKLFWTGKWDDKIH